MDECTRIQKDIIMFEENLQAIQQKTIRKEQKKQYYLKNKEYIASRNKKYQDEHREQLSKASKIWKLNNQGRVKLAWSKSRAKRERRCVSWANMSKMAEIYKNCPERMVVDHIIPLNGKFISGLHVENNLQYLSEKENLKKKNKFNFEEYKNTKHYKKWFNKIKKVRS